MKKLKKIWKKLTRAPAGVDSFVYLILNPELLPFNDQFPFPLLHLNLVLPMPVVAVEWLSNASSFHRTVGGHYSPAINSSKERVIPQERPPPLDKRGILFLQMPRPNEVME